MFEYDKHYRECQQQNKPFIKARINPKHGNYFVQVDLMTCNYTLSHHELEEIKDLVYGEIEFVKSHLKSNFQGFHIDKELSWFDGIPSEHVGTFCTSLYDLTQKHHN